jgi:exodeoxyribonuclease VIII
MPEQVTVPGAHPSAPNVPAIGAHRGVGFADYVAWRATNWHTLAPFALSSLQGRHEMTMPEDASPDMVFGGAFHSAILEPDAFAATYVVMPRFEGHPNSTAHKAAKAAWLEENSGKVSLTADEADRLKGMQAAVAAHPTASALVSGRGKNELSIVWRDRPTGELCKGRIDRLARVPARVIEHGAAGDAIVLVDLKKTSRFHRFDCEVAKFGYHAQLAFYLDGLGELDPAPVTPVIIAVQDEAPYDVVVYSVNDAVEHGRKLYRRLLDLLIRCRREDRWPGICPTGTLPIILPKYAQEDES